MKFLYSGFSLLHALSLITYCFLVLSIPSSPWLRWHFKPTPIFNHFACGHLTLHLLYVALCDIVIYRTYIIAIQVTASGSHNVLSVENYRGFVNVVTLGKYLKMGTEIREATM